MRNSSHDKHLHFGKVRLEVSRRRIFQVDSDNAPETGSGTNRVRPNLGQNFLESD
ncbi:hypothetical protein J6590_083654 [Homalodisca vitripennis]|nr:hypothetical protein J6590_083654 [Homalodisca vitripennis]